MVQAQSDYVADVLKVQWRSPYAGRHRKAREWVVGNRKIGLPTSATAALMIIRRYTDAEAETGASPFVPVSPSPRRTLEYPAAAINVDIARLDWQLLARCNFNDSRTTK